MAVLAAPRRAVRVGGLTTPILVVTVAATAVVGHGILMIAEGPVRVATMAR